MSRMGLIVAMVLGASAAGCAPSASDTAAPTENAVPTDTAAKLMATPVEITVGSIDEYNALLAKHRGKVVLVDFWATWCGPCVEKFPETVKLAEKYKSEGLATIAVSLDDPENLETVKTFLAAQQATFDNLLSKDGGSSASMEAFGLNAAVPHYRLYNRAGELVQSWDGEPEGLDAKIQELLSAK